MYLYQYFNFKSFDVPVGIVPLFCDDVFKQIEAKKAEGDKTEFEVSIIPSQLLTSFCLKKKRPLFQRNFNLIKGIDDQSADLDLVLICSVFLVIDYIQHVGNLQ